MVTGPHCTNPSSDGRASWPGQPRFPLCISGPTHPPDSCLGLRPNPPLGRPGIACSRT
jgi:hypothetical protein